MHNTSSIGYPKVIPYTEFEHFEIIMLRVDKQTNNQTVSNVLQ